MSQVTLCLFVQTVRRACRVLLDTSSHAQEGIPLHTMPPPVFPGPSPWDTPGMAHSKLKATRGHSEHQVLSAPKMHEVVAHVHLPSCTLDAADVHQSSCLPKMLDLEWWLALRLSANWHSPSSSILESPSVRSISATLKLVGWP